MTRSKHSYTPALKQSDFEIFVADKPISFVYFLRNPNDGNIKIGTSGNVDSRYLSLCHQHKSTLEFLSAIKGNRTLEAELHKQFAPAALGHEWFSPLPELMDYITKCPYHKIPKHEFPAPNVEYTNHVFSKNINDEIFNTLVQLFELNGDTTRMIKVTIISQKEKVSRDE